jgi:hypothetical protein
MKLIPAYIAPGVLAATRKIMSLKAHPVFLAEHIIQTPPAI